jgi:peptidyl-prolyl cis-trans isomerase B (cyclophilin B)
MWQSHGQMLQPDFDDIMTEGKSLMKIYRWFTALVLAGALLVSGCAGNSNTSTTAGSSTAATSTTETSVADSPTATAPQADASPTAPVANIPPQFSNLPRLEGEAVVEMVVKGSPITILVRGADAPITAGNFVDLVNRGVYNGLVFHRVVREPQPFVVQGGDPQSKDPNVPASQLGTGGFIDPNTGQERYIPLEIKPTGAEQAIYSQTLESAGVTDPPELRHTRGAVAMARSNLPDSASSQFYFALADLDFLNGNYAVFGYVTEGMEVVDQIQQGDRIDSARVTAGLNNLKPGS